MAGEAERIADGAEVRRVLIAVDLVAVEAANSAMVHHALHEVVALHAIFVGGEVGVLEEIGDARLQRFETPVVGEPLAGQEADRPVIIFSGDGAVERAALGVALHADVVGAHKVEVLRIHDVGFGGVLRRAGCRGRDTFRSRRSIR